MLSYPLLWLPALYLYKNYVRCKMRWEAENMGVNRVGLLAALLMLVLLLYGCVAVWVNMLRSKWAPPPPPPPPAHSLAAAQTQSEFLSSAGKSDWWLFSTAEGSHTCPVLDIRFVILLWSILKESFQYFLLFVGSKQKYQRQHWWAVSESEPVTPQSRHSVLIIC